MKHTSGICVPGVIAVALALFLAGVSAPSAAAPANKATEIRIGVDLNRATDMSARRRHWRRHRYVPQVYPYSTGYYRPRPYYYRPYGYYAPAPFFSFGFGPRYYW